MCDSTRANNRYILYMPSNAYIWYILALMNYRKDQILGTIRIDKNCQSLEEKKENIS